MSFKIISLVLLILSGSAFAFDKGGHSGGGGEEAAVEFVSIANEVFDTLMSRPLIYVDNKDLWDAIKKTKVLVADEELRLEDGTKVDAINYPTMDPPTIRIDEKAWEKLKDNRWLKAKLVFHEYLGIMNGLKPGNMYDDSLYQISSELDRGRICDISPSILNTIQFSIKKACYRILNDELIFSSELREANLKGKWGYLNSHDFKRLPNLTDLTIANIDLTDPKSSASPFEFTDLSLVSIKGLKVKDLSSNFFKGLKEDTWVAISPLIIKGKGNLKELSFINKPTTGTTTIILSGKNASLAGKLADVDAIQGLEINLMDNAKMTTDIFKDFSIQDDRHYSIHISAKTKDQFPNDFLNGPFQTNGLDDYNAYLTLHITHPEVISQNAVNNLVNNNITSNIVVPAQKKEELKLLMKKFEATKKVLCATRKARYGRTENALELHCFHKS